MADNALMALEQRIARAQEAKRDLAIIQPRLDSLREGYIVAWRASQASQSDAREKIWLAYQAVDAIERDLKAKITDAQAAQAEIDLMKVSE
jgi:hypothetical protein